ncbi:hypothetical protein C8N47_103251 [Mangrovibacterium marinum]|uniref:Uncharacterized protein n=2 Tax=Mangrovibacterium marinum TaxID=1639118 RepID=A0A2T5C512_9BACT|nr:hypothetical protein C8N47_103251 [Mangrovibacterium marinum]
MTGFVPGLIIPLVVFVLLYFFSKQEVSLSEYLQTLWQLGALLKILSLCVLPNLLLFLNFYRQKYDLAARGVIMATFVYAFAVMLVKVL